MQMGTQAQGLTAQPEFAKTTKSGIDLATFEKVELTKQYPKPAPVTSVQDALSRLNNDNAKLLKIIQEGLQAEAGREARNDENGWLVLGDDGKPETNEDGTAKVYAGTLVSNEILNPVVLMFARLNETTVVRGDKEVSITWDEAKDADEKRAVKAAAVEMIRQQPGTVAALKKKMAASQKSEE